MNNMRNMESVQNQYSNSDNLSIRISIHTKYSINKQGFSNWIKWDVHFRQIVDAFDKGEL